MKRMIAPSTGYAKAWWAANPNAHFADCFSVALPTGAVIYSTTGQWDVTVPAALSPTGSALTFKALDYGVWSRGKIVSEAGFKCTSNTMSLSVVPKMGAMYPGLNISVLNAAVNHLFDGGTVWVYTAWMPLGQYGNVQVFETKFQGRIIRSPKIGRAECQFDVADPLFLLNAKVPSRVFLSSCYKSFADANCGLDPTLYTVSFAAASTAQSVLTPAVAFARADGYFTQGVVTCVTGGNAGLSVTVKAHAAGALQLVSPWLLPVQVGDTFSVIKGCDQTPTTCAGMVRASGTAEAGDWRKRFGGTPYMPVPSNAL